MAALRAIELDDSDGDGYTSRAEIGADRYSGNAGDDPSKVPAPYRIYSRVQLERVTRHTQFLPMNTSRSVDFYAGYAGVPRKNLLAFEIFLKI